MAASNQWEKAVLVYKSKGFKPELTEHERSYIVSSKDGFFVKNAPNQKLYGDALDGSEKDVRLDAYMFERNSWEVDYCYIVYHQIGHWL